MTIKKMALTLPPTGSPNPLNSNCTSTLCLPPLWSLISYSSACARLRLLCTITKMATVTMIVAAGSEISKTRAASELNPQVAAPGGFNIPQAIGAVTLKGQYVPAGQISQFDSLFKKYPRLQGLVKNTLRAHQPPHAAGGVPQVMRQLSDSPVRVHCPHHNSCLPIQGQNIAGQC